MKYDAQSFTLVENKEIAKGIFDWTVKNENLAKISLPGQFAHVSVPGKPLRRPISICDVQGDTLRLVFQVKGEGTEIMSRQTPGAEVDILAPLGNGFKIEKGKRYCFIGGGIGVPPMLYCAKQTENPLVITGFRNKDLVILQEDFKNAGAELYMTTDDGSAGIHGFVTDVLKEKINEADVGYIINIFDFLPVKFLFFEEDCDFPPEIKFLWDENVLDYIRFETTFFAFSHLLHRIAEVIEGEI